MYKRFCDKCGSQVHPAGHAHQKTNPMKLTITNETWATNHNTVYDICRDCQENFVKFLQNFLEGKYDIKDTNS